MNPKKNEMITTSCAICGKRQQVRELYPATFTKAVVNPAVYSARRVPDRVHYRMVKCERCGLIFSSPILPADKIAQLYRQSECTYSKQIPYTRQTYVKLFTKIKSRLPVHPKVLEVGCGNGFFLLALKNQGADVWGVEPGKKCLKKTPLWLKRRIITDIFRPRQFATQSFDVVCIFHTLDHLTKPNDCIKEVYRLLKPGGWILAVVHDTDGLSVKLFGERSPIFDIEHVYLFNKRTLKQLLERQRFLVAEVADLVNTYPLHYWLTMSGLPKWIKNWGYKALKWFGVDTLPMSLAGGNIAIMAQKV